MRSRVSIRARSSVVVLLFALAIVGAQSAYAGGGGGGAAPKFRLPWAIGASWRMTGGPHSNTGRGRPWSAIDFEGAIPGGSYPVRAVADGTVVRPCANWVKIRHANGWETGYYHLARIQVRAGQRVAAGQLLGFTSTQAGCGGSATGAHVHFSVQRYGRYVPVNGLVLGGWTVRAGPTQYVGCLVRGGSRRCAPTGPIYNFGT
jgi:LasA protease